MKFTEAYKRLGYELSNPRTAWSGEKPDGIAISIWKKRIRDKDGLPYFDTRETGSPPQGDSRIGRISLMKHLQKAWTDFDGRVDVVVLTGVPGEGYESADPWLVPSRGGYWKLKEFDPTTGHFRVEVVATPKASATKGE